MNENLIDYYANLLLLQFVKKPKAISTVKTCLTSVIIYDLIISVRDGYNLTTAIGNQLDVIGKYVGIYRVIKGFALEYPAFGYLRYGETPPSVLIEGYNRYGISQTGHFRRYSDASEVYTLTDSEMRMSITLAILKIHSNASMDTVDQMLFPIFSTDYLVVETPMTINYFIKSTRARTADILNIQGLFPKPSGVKLNITIKPILSS